MSTFIRDALALVCVMGFLSIPIQMWEKWIAPEPVESKAEKVCAPFDRYGVPLSGYMAERADGSDHLTSIQCLYQKRRKI